jgi:membrane dipeptidase
MKKLVGAVCVLVVAVVALRFWAPTVVENHYNRVLARPPYAIPAPAAALQQKLFVADLHADTLLWGPNLLKRGTSGHVDLPRLRQANVSLQFFTVVTTIPRKLNIERNSSTSDLIRYLAALEGWPLRTWSSPKERALYQAARLQHFASDSEGELVVLRTRSDLQTFLADRDRGRYKLAALLGAEGAQPLEGTLENLDVLYAAGYRMMAPTHFTDTEIGGSASGPSKSGLTNLGRPAMGAPDGSQKYVDRSGARLARNVA